MLAGIDHLHGIEAYVYGEEYHCKECGEVLYPVKYRDTLTEESGEAPELVCPKHRKSTAKDTWKHAMTTTKKAKTVTK